MITETYKDRVLDPSREVWVYRNLTRKDGPWFSIMQDGLVIGYARCVILKNVHFVVRQSGRRRTIRDKRKNVHAFVVGTMDTGIPIGARLPFTYNPFKWSTFVVWRNWTGGGPIPAQMIGDPEPVLSARSVILQSDGTNLVELK